MNQLVQNEIYKKIEKLEPKVQEAIRSLDWISISGEMGREYLLDEGEVELFQTEVGLVISGLEPLEYLSKNIEENIEISKSEAEKITQISKEKIFLPIFEKITENDKNEKPNQEEKWEDTLDFIMSGGNN